MISDKIQKKKMKGVVVFLFVLFVSLSTAVPASCKGKTNQLPVDTSAPRFVKQVTNGKHYITNATGVPVHLLHVYGTPYEMGYAHGQMLKDEIHDLYPQIEQYIYSEVEKSLQFLPKFMRDFVAEYGTSGALLLTYELTKGYTPDYWFEELRGIADGSGMSYNRILEIHMFPELIQAACSMVGAWGEATINADIDGSLVQLRALDWSVKGPFQKIPAVIVYHPEENMGHPFSIVSWAGFVGTISGMSSNPFGVCEKVWLAYNGTKSRSGYPWHFMLRDILQFDVTVDDAINRISSTARTCSIWIGLGTPEDHFKAVSYSHDYYRVYDDRNFPEYPGHPRFKDAVYIDKHVQPSHDSCLGDLMGEHYGNINALTLFQNMAAELQTGDMQVCVYDFKNMLMYVSNAAPYNPNGQFTRAYDNHFTMFNMTELFAEEIVSME
eukprot:TRINITY_DN3141_c5_g1_i1.p1 TRINITY_DN3141_c5_g1~~TRINITY_DN3141_c5_g1_i1.p1  ORF type:complete len:438 (+),score=105.66 TRINITY_DN3141_c5_g1_i1:88-1401(+)